MTEPQIISGAERMPLMPIDSEHNNKFSFLADTGPTFARLRDEIRPKTREVELNYHCFPLFSMVSWILPRREGLLRSARTL